MKRRLLLFERRGKNVTALTCEFDDNGI